MISFRTSRRSTEASDVATSDMSIVISTSGPTPTFGPALLRSIECEATRVRLVHDGIERFDGTPRDLLGLSIGHDGLAGEHPIERSLRHLVSSAT